MGIHVLLSEKSKRNAFFKISYLLQFFFLNKENPYLGVYTYEARGVMWHRSREFDLHCNPRKIASLRHRLELGSSEHAHWTRPLYCDTVQGPGDTGECKAGAALALLHNNPALGSPAHEDRSSSI